MRDLDPLAKVVVLNLAQFLSLVCLETLVQILQGTESCYLPVAI